MEWQPLKPIAGPLVLMVSIMAVEYMFGRSGCGSSTTVRLTSAAARQYHSDHVQTKLPLVTFIIPSQGRDTLNRTLSSLLAQSRPDWRAIVVCDGVDIPVPVQDGRITFTKTAKTGTSNHAAQLRNFGIMKSQTGWVAFVDDDDTVSATYVQHLEEELTLTPSLECVIFRMLQNPETVLPGPKETNFVIAQVGISFAVKRDLYMQGFIFVPGSVEDFEFLNTLRQHGKKMVISRHTTYFVRSGPVPDNFVNMTVRAIIN